MIPLLFALSCLPVDGPKLLAKHLARAISAFGQVPPETELGYSPVPGAVRVIRGAELQSIAARHGIAVELPAEGLCFEWTVAPLEAARLAEAMRKSLPENAKLEIKEISRFPVPSGELEFPLKGLNAGLWRGQLKYASNGRIHVWARVQVSVKQPRVISVVPLKAGERITAEQLRIEEIESEPASEYASRLEDVIGHLPKSSFADGSFLLLRMLEEPLAVLKGDTVRLRASAGAARLTMEAQAQAAGRVGDFIAVKNTSSGRIVRARVDSTGEVSLTR